MTRPRRSLSPRSLLLPVAVLASGGLAAACGHGGNELPEPPDVVRAGHQVPSIIGGTMMISRDGTTAVAADPDRDRVSLVDIASAKVKTTVAFDRYDEPGRVIEDGSGRAHVALRRAGQLATIDLATGELLRRGAVCASPRGMAYDGEADALVVACASGELVVVEPSSLEVLRVDRIDRDLRDVAIRSGDAGPELAISLFRSAQILTVTDPLAGADVEVIGRRSLPSTEAFDEFTPQAAARVAWRATALADGDLLVVHQQHLSSTIDIAPAQSYTSAGPCGNGIVQSSVTILPRDPAEPPEVLPLGMAVLPVDAAARDDGDQVAIAAAASNQVIVVDRPSFTTSNGFAPCGATSVPGLVRDIPETPVAVAYTLGGEVLVQTREPATIVFPSELRVELGGESVLDTGHEMFHRPPGPVSLSCASCHPEGGDDAHTWSFSPFGARRTQTLRGGILETAPLHWDGTLEDMGALVDEVMVGRMGGGGPGPRAERAMSSWMDGLAALTPSPSRAPDAVSRGAALFHDPTVACNDCHSGPMYTNNETVDVGTGQALQVPTLLNVADRAPFMHDGCAATLADRFHDSACGGGDLHGKTSHLTPEQVDDLVAYLESL